MTEYRLQQSTFPSTAEYHKDRERAPHLEQDWQKGRIYAAAKLIRQVKPKSVVDLGCGDGGLLSLLKDTCPAWGYDFAPANAEGWKERQVEAYLQDVFNDEGFQPRWGELTVMTEVLEHLADPHFVIDWVAHNTKWLVASVPFDERPDSGIVEGCHEHIHGWDEAGFRDLVGEHFSILEYKRVDFNQLMLAKSRYN